MKQMWEQLNGPGARSQEWGPERWKSITGRKEVEDIMVPWCAEHFNQAAETTFARGKWEKELDILDEASRVEETLEGRYGGIERESGRVRQWLEGLKRKDGVEGMVELKTELGRLRNLLKR